MVNIGDSIHTKYGQGIIESVRGNVAIVRLPHKDNLPIPIRIDGTEPKIAQSESLANSDYPNEDISYASDKHSLEALRFGLVPYPAIEALTIDYPSIRNWVISRLPDRNDSTPQLSRISGEFGSGKSHMMGIIRHIALQEGYLTVHAEIDGKKVALSDPEQLLLAIADSVEGTLSESASWVEMCLASIRQRKRAPSIRRDIDRIKDNYNTIELLNTQELRDLYSDDMNSVLSSRTPPTASDVSQRIKTNSKVDKYSVNVRKMIGQKLIERPNDFVEALVGYTNLATLSGYKGLILTLDEFEVGSLNPNATLQKTIKLLRILSEYWSGALDHLPQVPMGMFVATVDGEDIQNQIMKELLTDPVNHTYQVKSLGREDRRDLAQQIYKLYAESYGIKEAYTDQIFNSVEQELSSKDVHVMRAFVKEYVAALDSHYGPGPL